MIFQKPIRNVRNLLFWKQKSFQIEKEKSIEKWNTLGIELTEMQELKSYMDELCDSQQQLETNQKQWNQWKKNQTFHFNLDSNQTRVCIGYKFMELIIDNSLDLDRKDPFFENLLDIDHLAKDVRKNIDFLNHIYAGNTHKNLALHCKTLISFCFLIFHFVYFMDKKTKKESKFFITKIFTSLVRDLKGYKQYSQDIVSNEKILYLQKYFQTIF